MHVAERQLFYSPGQKRGRSPLTFPLQRARDHLLASVCLEARGLLQRIPQPLAEAWLLCEGLRQYQCAVAVKILARNPLHFWGDCAVESAGGSLLGALGREQGKPLRASFGGGGIERGPAAKSLESENLILQGPIEQGL